MLVLKALLTLTFLHLYGFELFTLENVYIKHGTTQDNTYKKRYLIEDIQQLLKNPEGAEFINLKMNIEQALILAMQNATLTLNVTRTNLKSFKDDVFYSISEVTIDNSLRDLPLVDVIKFMYETLSDYLNSINYIENGPDFYSEILKNGLVVISAGQCFKYERSRCDCYMDMFNISQCPPVPTSTLTTSTTTSTSPLTTTSSPTTNTTSSPIKTASSQTTTSSPLTTTSSPTTNTTSSPTKTASSQTTTTSPRKTSPTPTTTSSQTITAALPMTMTSINTSTTPLVYTTTSSETSTMNNNSTTEVVAPTSSNQKADDTDYLQLGLIIGGACLFLLFIILSLFAIRYYRRKDRSTYPIKRKEKLSFKSMLPSPGISPEVDFLELKEGDSKYAKPLTIFNQPFTGHFTFLPNSNSDVNGNTNRDSGISLLDVFDEQEKNDNEVNSSNLAPTTIDRSVRNPVFLDDDDHRIQIFDPNVNNCEDHENLKETDVTNPAENDLSKDATILRLLNAFSENKATNEGVQEPNETVMNKNNLAYENPLFKEENKIHSYANPLFCENENEEVLKDDTENKEQTQSRKPVPAKRTSVSKLSNTNQINSGDNIDGKENAPKATKRNIPDSVRKEPKKPSRKPPKPNVQPKIHTETTSMAPKNDTSGSEFAEIQVTTPNVESKSVKENSSNESKKDKSLTENEPSEAEAMLVEPADTFKEPIKTLQNLDGSESPEKSKVEKEEPLALPDKPERFKKSFKTTLSNKHNADSDVIKNESNEDKPVEEADETEQLRESSTPVSPNTANAEQKDKTKKPAKTPRLPSVKSTNPVETPPSITPRRDRSKSDVTEKETKKPVNPPPPPPIAPKPQLPLSSLKRSKTAPPVAPKPKLDKNNSKDLASNGSN